MNGLIEWYCRMARGTPVLDEGQRRMVTNAFEDTLAVALAGWSMPVVRAVLKVNPGVAPPLGGPSTAQPDQVALVHGTAAHALDYDDVNMLAVTHPSTVIIPALAAVAATRPEVRGRLAAAYTVGMTVTTGVGRALGFGHYAAGWHATSTIGPLAAAAALAHLLELDDSQTRYAASLAVAQSAGMQRNFGSMAKPLQAGFAAAAAVRSALLAEAGVDAADDPFGAQGFLDLYAGLERPVSYELPEDYELDVISMKLFPCCYATHRLIAAGLDVRKQLGANPPAGAEVEVEVPFGLLQPLKVYDPANGNEAKFCAAYTIAVAMTQGSVTLADFEDEAVSRPHIRELMDRIAVSEEALEGAMPAGGLDRGEIQMDVREGDRVIARSTIAAYPGSPSAPASDEALEVKLNDCLGVFGRQTNQALSVAEFRRRMQRELAL